MFELFLIALFICFFVMESGDEKPVNISKKKFINEYIFPITVTKKIIEKYPHLTDDDAATVMRALRQYFHICHDSPNSIIAMPSQVVDVAWHEFIIFTERYNKFSHSAIGHFLDHIPAEVMPTKTASIEGLAISWNLSCKGEKINASNPSQLPLLFKIDEMLNIPDGYHYALEDIRKDGYPVQRGVDAGYFVEKQIDAAAAGCGGGGCGGGG